MRQMETMLKQCIDYSELGMMLMVRLDGMVERDARRHDTLNPHPNLTQNLAST
jgi:hypothetical protein